MNEVNQERNFLHMTCNGRNSMTRASEPRLWKRNAPREDEDGVSVLEAV
jgi:hypothetical protein